MNDVKDRHTHNHHHQQQRQQRQHHHRPQQQQQHHHKHHECMPTADLDSRSHQQECQTEAGMETAALQRISGNKPCRGSSSAGSLSTADVAVAVSSNSSIYDLRSRSARWLILLGVAVAALLVPFTDSIYFPALPAVGQDLNASEAAVAATVAVFMFTVGLGNLFWGPFSDRYGRRLTYNLSTVVFLGTTIGCFFSPNVGVLIALRAFQGFAQCSFLTTGQAVIADVFPPAVRGTMMGVHMLAVLTGPVIGPVMGGALSEAYGWRATFVFLAIFCGAVGALLFLFLPETHQYLTLQRLSAKDPQCVQQIHEADKILAVKPVFHLPWTVLRYLHTPEFAPYVIINAWANAALFGCLTLWPVFLAAAPYSLSQTMIGVSYLADGLGAVTGSLVGGVLSDRGAIRWSGAHEGRVVWNVLTALLFMPAGFLLYGWGFNADLHLGGLLVSSFLVSFGAAALMPGVYSFVSCVDQANAGSATAAVNAAWCMLAGVIVVVSVPGVSSLGVGGYFTLLACIHVALSIAAGLCIARKLRMSRLPNLSTPT